MSEAVKSDAVEEVGGALAPRLTHGGVTGELRRALSGVRHLDQYFGVWAIDEPTFRAAVDRVCGMDLVAHIRSYEDDDVSSEPRPAARLGAAAGASSTYRNGYWVTSDGVAVIELVGEMLKYGSSFSEGTATVRVRQAIRNAGRDDLVTGILLVVDSPGGTVAGTPDLAMEVGKAASQKRVVAYIEDMGASAAYWVASQASAVYVNANGLVGSIGTFAVLEDYTGRAAQLGIKVHVVRAGEFKGEGVPGTEVSAKLLGEVQRIVTTLNGQFLAAVRGARGFSEERMRELADGRVHVGEAAVALGLVDGVKTFDAVMEEMVGGKGKKSGVRSLESGGVVADAALAGETPAPQECVESTSPALAGFAVTTEDDVMSGVGQAAAPAVPVAATLSELREHLVGASSDFILGQLESGATLVDALKAHTASQASALAAASQAAEELKASGGKKPGVPAMVERKGSGSSSSADDGADPVEQFESRIGELVGKGMDRFRAINVVVARDPELHKAYLLAKNPGPKVQRLIKEKYE